MDRYGVNNYIELFKGKFIKENSPVWKGGAKTSREERSTYEYTQWRKSVFSRDMYACVCCKAKSKHGCRVNLHAHHIQNWADHIDDRYNVDNGVTLCDKCHYNFHSIYGKKNNTYEQIAEYIKQSKMN